MGLAGRTSLEQAQVDEVVDVVQDLTNTWVRLYFTRDEAGLRRFADVTLTTALAQLERRLAARGGRHFVGSSLSWADLHVFMYLGDGEYKLAGREELYPNLANLYARVGDIPNIKAWIEARPKTELPAKSPF